LSQMKLRMWTSVTGLTLQFKLFLPTFIEYLIYPRCWAVV
jgi:hypothetical protein